MLNEKMYNYRIEKRKLKLIVFLTEKTEYSVILSESII